MNRIVTDILWGREFFQFYGMPPGMVPRQCVSLRSAPGAPKGDVDVLFSAPSIPEHAMDSAPSTVGTHGLDICRFSKPAEQSEELTNWVASIFKT